MAANIFANVTTRGVKAEFMEAMDGAPTVWDKHCQIIPSDAKDENHAWLGTLPIPRHKLSGRNFQSLRDFTLTITNRTYEMSYVIDRDTAEDDQTGFVARANQDAALAWSTFHDSLFSTLIEAGTSDNAFNGTSFFNDSHTIGDSAAFDNSLAVSMTADNPTLANMEDGVKDMIAAMALFQDEQGRVGYTSQAMTKLRLIVPATYLRRTTELIKSQLTNSGSSNPYYLNLLEVDMLPNLTAAADDIYLSAVGRSKRMPFIYQARTNLEIVVYNSTEHIADNDGLKVLTRQRFRFGYGDPRFCVLNTGD